MKNYKKICLEYFLELAITINYLKILARLNCSIQKVWKLSLF